MISTTGVIEYDKGAPVCHQAAQQYFPGSGCECVVGWVTQSDQQVVHDSSVVDHSGVGEAVEVNEEITVVELVPHCVRPMHGKGGLTHAWHAVEDDHAAAD